MRVLRLVTVLLLIFCCIQSAYAEKRITLATHTWEPYVGESMPKQGITASIVRLAFEKAGYTVEMSFHDWDTALNKAKNGKTDGLFPTYHTKEREQYFLYSDSFAVSPLGLCKQRPLHSFSPGGLEYDKKNKFRREIIRYKTDPRIDQTEALKDLKDYTFGVGRRYANTKEFDEADFLTKKEVTNDEENILQLLQGDVDLIVIDKYVAKNIIARKFPWRTGDVEFMEPPLAMRKLYLTIPKGIEGAQEKMEAFNKGLHILKEEGTIKKLQRVYGF